MSSTTVDPTSVVLEVLNQFTNYERWSLAVKNYLITEDLWDVVEDSTEPSKQNELEKYKLWRRNNARALGAIRNCCGAYNSNFISKATLAKDAWDTLADLFKPVFFETTVEGSSDDVTNNNNMDDETELEDNTDIDPHPVLEASADDQWHPVLLAYANDRWEEARNIYDRTPLKDLKNRSGAELISQSFTKTEVDIAWNLLHRCPGLAVATDFFGHSPINALAGMRCAFLSGRPMRFWEQWIYNCIHIELDLNNEKEVPKVEENQRNINVIGMRSLRELVARLLKLWIPEHYNRIYKMKLIHHQNLEFLQFMCKVTTTIHEDKQLRFVQSAIFKAVERGNVEFITRIIEVNPDCVTLVDAKGMNMFQFAIECRKEKVHNLIYGLSEEHRRNLMEGSFDGLNSTVLHLVGRLPSYGQLDHIQDAALRMQREVQWLKEVENLLPTSLHDIMNFMDNMTAHELFTKNHKQLKNEGEKSMKGTATSCTVVAALIVTIMFAAAFTVPGGNNGGTGIPILVHKNWFVVFMVSDAISLCCSTTSVIIFLGILTSRYAEVDFLRSLPTKMIFGLLTLFLAITTMMVAFTSAIYILLESKSGIGIPVILLGAIPVITFVLMQFRLLKEMIISTYGGRLFRRDAKHRDAKHWCLAPFEKDPEFEV